MRDDGREVGARAGGGRSYNFINPVMSVKRIAGINGISLVTEQRILLRLPAEHWPVRRERPRDAMNHARSFFSAAVI